MLAVLTPGVARAGKLLGGNGVCPLHHSPWVPHRATPQPWECSIDEDDDGLDDEIESALADCFAPQLHFTPDEPALAVDIKFPGGREPFTVFNAYPDGANPNVVHIKYGTFFGKDGGYFDNVVYIPNVPVPIGYCGQGENKHDGDSMSIEVEVELVTGSDGRTEAQLLRVEGWHRDLAGTDSSALSCSVATDLIDQVLFPYFRLIECRPPAQVETLRLGTVNGSATHPIVFASWGKHHYYLNPPDGTWGRQKGQVLDPIAGAICALFGCSGWVDVYEAVEKTTKTGALVVNPVLHWAYPTAQDKPVPTNVGAVIDPSANPLVSDRDELCQGYTAMYAAVCACDPTAFPACAAAPSDPTACPTVKSLRDINCNPPPSADSPPASACLARKNTSGPSKFIGSIGQLYPGASIQSGSNFCGTGQGLAGNLPPGCSSPGCSSPLRHIMAGLDSTTLDSDGDGVPNHSDLCPGKKPPFFLGAHLDSDGDGAGNDCDPSELRDLYVGGKGFPALAATGYQSGPGFAVDYKRRGWADTDSDGQLNGADFCPSTPGVVAEKFANVNEWGERASFPGTGSPAFASYAQQNDPLLGSYTPSEKNPGFLTRGTLCDPYEASAMKEDTTEPDEVQGDPCPPLGLFGKNEVFLSVTPARGVSANDPALTGTSSTYVDRLKATLEQAQPVLLDARRCGCPEFGSTGKAACLDRETGSCRQVSPLPSFPDTGRQWLRVERKGCAHETLAGQPYCRPLPARAGVPPPVICPIGPSASCPPSDPAFWPKPYDMSWAWVQEAKTYPAHFPSDWLSTGIDIVTKKPYLKTKPGLRFTFATRTFLSLTGADGKPVDTDAKPHRYPAHPQLTRVVGNQADPNPDRESTTGATVPLQVGNERAGNLRTTFTERFIQPIEPHLAINQDPTCPDFVNASPASDAIHMAYGPGCWPPWICFQSLDRDSVLVRAGDLTLAALLRFGAGGRAQPIQVTSPDGSILGGLDCLVSGDCGGLGIAAGGAAPAGAAIASGPVPWRLAVLAPEAAGGARHGARPGLVLVAGSGATGRADRLWALSAASTTGARARYVVTRTGTALPGTALADVFLETGSNAIVAFGEPDAETAAWLRVLDLETFEWTELPVDPSLPGRSGAGYALFDTALYRAGGHDGTELRGDVVAIDWRSGTIADTGLTGEPFPRRSGPFLGWDAQGAGLIYAGGADAWGVAHSDVWSLRVGVSDASRIARDVALPPGSQAIDRGSMLLASGASGQALWWTVGQIGASDQVTHSVRIAEGGGWVDADPRTLAASFPRCEDGTEARRCATGTEWWRAPGALCDSTCRARLSETSAALAQLPGTGASDIALEGSSLWVARGNDVDLWTLLSGKAEKITSIPLGSPVRALAEQDGLLAAATDAGISRMLGGTASSTALGAPVDVCGVPPDLVGVGEGQWVVATTAGAALLRTSSEGVLEIASEGFLESTPSGWTLVPRSTSAAHSKKCAVLDKAGCGAFCGPDLPRRLAFDGREIELARGLALIRLRWNGDGVLAVHDSLKAQGVIRGVKSTGSVSYLVPGGLLGNKEDAVSLGATLTPAGKHDVGDWVLSEQSGPFRARLKPGGRVEIAWVGP
ncbi:MAG: hypothetical protein HS104_34695 [Polyangiaceae bacterium]|nr:hypothetical protein [Polyangiaceae bacterium]